MNLSSYRFMYILFYLSMKYVSRFIDLSIFISSFLFLYFAISLCTYLSAYLHI